MVNDPHLAKDVTQGVFVALTKDAGKLTDHPVLSGWLHRTARNIAAQTIRTEVRRKTREKDFATMNESPETDAPWKEIAPHLDAALAELGESDRDAVLLRYFENKSANHMAAILGISAEAAQKRVSRAVERLREKLAKRGISAGAAGLAGLISVNAVQVAPVGLAVTLSSAALTGTTVPAAITGKALTAAAITLLAAAGIYHLTRTANPPREISRTQAPSVMTQKPRPAEGNSLVKTMVRTRAEAPRIDRKKALDGLKEKWLEHSKKLNQPGVLSTNEEMAEEKALREESARLLLCGQEAVELLAFLEQHRIYNGINHAIADVISSPSATEARALLVDLPEGPANGSENLREKWSGEAGRGCPEAEFEAFQAALKCERCAQEALFGRNQTLMRTDAVAALDSTLQALESNVPSMNRSKSVWMLFERELPMNVDFEALEKLLPNHTKTPAISRSDPKWHPGDWLQPGREQLFTKWAKVDSVAAANHVLTNPDRCPPKLIETISKALVLTDPAIAREWVERFPEGPHFDEAADEAVWNLAMDHPDEALRLTSRISNPEVKKRALQRVDKFQKIKRGEAGFEEGG